MSTFKDPGQKTNSTLPYDVKMQQLPFYSQSAVSDVKKQVGHFCPTEIAICILVQSKGNAAKKSELMAKVGKSLAELEDLFNANIKANGPVSILNVGILPNLSTENGQLPKMTFERFLSIAFSDIFVLFAYDRDFRDTFPVSSDGYYVNGNTVSMRGYYFIGPPPKDSYSSLLGLSPPRKSRVYHRALLDVSSAIMFVENPSRFVSDVKIYKNAPIAQNACFMFRSLRNKNLSELFKTNPFQLEYLMVVSGAFGGQIAWSAFARDNVLPFEKTAKSFEENNALWQEIMKYAGHNTSIILTVFGQMESNIAGVVFDNVVDTKSNLKMMRDILKDGMGKELQAVNLNNIKNETDATLMMKKAAELSFKYEEVVFSTIKDKNKLLFKLAAPFMGEIKTGSKKIK